MRWGMAVDLKKCTGCGACAVACKQENATPPGVFWSRVHIYETGIYPHATLRFLPTLCMQCDEPSCHKACPTGATTKRPDGIVAIDDEQCIGCGYCAWACPYEARELIRTTPRAYHPAHGYTPFEARGYIQHRKGKIEKCNFCAHRLDANMLPACVATCPSGARTFGNLDDLESEISGLLAKRRAHRLYEELGTEPKVFYLDMEEVLSDRETAIEARDSGDSEESEEPEGAGRPPGERYVRLLPHSRARSRTSLAATPVSASCHSGVLPFGRLGDTVIIWARRFWKPTVRSATYSSS